MVLNVGCLPEKDIYWLLNFQLSISFVFSTLARTAIERDDDTTLSSWFFNDNCYARKINAQQRQ